MIEIPGDKKERLALANELIETCRVSVGMRSSYYRTLNAICETGRYDGTKSLINMLHVIIDRIASHLFSPVELKFTVDFETPKPKHWTERAAEVAKVLTRSWERSNTDIMFARGVFEALKYGACFMKQWVQMEGPPEKDRPNYYRKLVMPWQFGVYREDVNDLDTQEALCETVTLTMPEVWQRIWFLPNAEKLFSQIKSHGKAGEASSDPQSFFHQVLSTSQLNTGVQGMTRPLPGGIVQLNNDPNYSVMGPVVATPVVQMHELWVKDVDDYTTIQVIEPDILIAPLYKKANLLIKDSQLQPYRIIQPNEVTNWIWGRSELVDLIEPQALLSTWCDDVKRMFGLQIDKIIAFIGGNNIQDEQYGAMRAAGYMSLEQGASVTDLTPKMPPEAMAMLKFCIDTIDMLSGMQGIMQGKGEPGIRSDAHAGRAQKMASPTLRDRSLIVERQCATHADLTLALKEAKDENYYWTKADQIQDIEQTKFLLSEMPDDWRVSIDSHSGSPIFSDENVQLVFAAHAKGIVNNDYVIDNTPLPNKESAKQANREKEKKQAEFMNKLLQDKPEIADKLLEKQAGARGGKR